MIYKNLVRFFDDLFLKLAERDILDSNKTADEVVDGRFSCPTPEIRSQIRSKVVEYRKKGKVNWNDKIEI